MVEDEDGDVIASISKNNEDHPTDSDSDDNPITHKLQALVNVVVQGWSG